MARDAPSDIRKTHSIRFTDDEWQRIRSRAKATGLSVAEYLISVSDAVEASGASAPTDASADTADRSMHRAVWFLYVDRLNQLKAAGQQSRVDILVTEAKRKFG